MRRMTYFIARSKFGGGENLNNPNETYFSNLRTKGSGCTDGSKFVLKSGGGVRKQFLFTNGKVIVSFVKAGDQFANCQTMTEVTSNVQCKVGRGSTS